jgi:hypothetical protein
MSTAERRHREPRSGAILVLLVTAAALWQLLVREVYHRGGGEESNMLHVLAAACLLLVVLGTASRARHPAIESVLARTAVVLVVFHALYRLGAFPGLQGWGQHPRLWQWAMLLSIIAITLLLVLRLTSQNWRHASQALMVATVAWVATPHALVWARSPFIEWPSGTTPQDAEAARGKVVTIVLLLDEMNSKDGPVIAEELERAGLIVSAASVSSVGPNTRNVLATLFHGSTFLNAQPCGFTAVCTDRLALDFSRVEASRPDIDIVGTAHPYCAIAGLRHCVRHTEQLFSRFDDRIRCSALRLTGISIGVDEAKCRAVYLDGFNRANQLNIQRVLEAPALTQGGVLFAHVLLPHPPGSDSRGTLATHYRDNLELARRLVSQILQVTRSSGLQTRWITFSDHPLRQALWCSSFAPYVWDGCVPTPDLDDQLVPIITASENGLNIEDLSSNRDVFSLIARIKP